MAEQVQAILDAMVAPLANLREREIFTADELAATIARRREMEYRLQRKRHARVSDNIAYIAVEEQLEQLRRVRMQKKERTKRKRKQQKDDDDPEQDERNRLGDRHILSHILLIWKRTLQKFPSPELFLQYAASCERLQAHFALARCYQNGLALYGTTHAALWTGAAHHELVHNNAVGAARILLQRGLRVLRADRFPVWRASFVLELHWVQKLEGRRAILQSTPPNEDDTTTTTTNKDAYKVAKIVYQNAMAADEATPLWTWKFLDACQGFPAETLEQWILDQQSEKAETDPDMWIARAQYYDAKRSNINEDRPAKRSKTTERNNDDTALSNPVLNTIRQACSTLPTPAMYGKALEFLGSYDDDDDDEATQALLQELLANIAQNEQLQDSADLMLCYIDSLGDDSRAASHALSQYVKSREASTTIDVSIWTAWAHHVYQTDGADAALAILEPNPYPLSDPQHIVILVQQLGLQIVLQQNQNEHKASLYALLERILLLTPANPMALCHRPVVEEGSHLPAVGVLLLDQYRDNRTLARKAYTALLAVQCWNVWVREAPDSVRGLIDAALAVEDDEGSTKQQKLLYVKAIESFKGCLPELAREYRQRRDNAVRFRHVAAALTVQGSIAAVPCVDYTTTNQATATRHVQELYRTFRICLVRNVRQPNAGPAKWQDMHTLFQSLAETDTASWSIESSSSPPTSISPNSMLSPSHDATKTRVYCSFIVQNDKTAYDHATQHVLPFLSFSDINWQYESALWFFFGRNPVGSPTLRGRPEHTDAISHDGTWHYQLSGTKTWYVRPTEELLLLQKEHPPPRLRDTTRFTVHCEPGDVLIINTRLWFHRTEIPPQSDPSVSYARDFVIDGTQQKVQPSPSSMTNVEGMYATKDIEEGSVIFTEADMPDGELHRSSNANCSVCELEHGVQAVVSVRPIKSGEFFCIPESDDEGSCSTDESSDE